MNSRYLALMLMFIVVVSVLPVVSGENTANDIYVSPDGNNKNSGVTEDQPKKTINKALDVVKTGGTVHVAKGTYKENVIICRDVKLVGEDPKNTIIDGNHEWYSISMYHANAVLVKGFTIINGETRFGANYVVLEYMLMIPS